MQNIGKAIKFYRKGLALTQLDLAKSANVSVNTIRLYEGNKISPSLETLYKIANALDIKLEDLIGIKTFKIGADFDEARKQELAALAAGDPDALSITHGADGTEQYTYTPSRREQLNVAFERLNPTGQQRAVSAVEDLAKVPEYQRGSKVSEKE